MKKKLFTIAMICVLAAGLSACSQKTDNQQSDHAGNTEKTKQEIIVIIIL